MTCPKCQSENLATAKFCAECGTKLRALCAQCGVEVLPTAKFCHECGVPLTSPTTATAAPRAVNLEEQFATFRQALPVSFRDQLLTQAEGENRVVTVLFADMSHSMERTQDLHPEEGADLVNRLLQMIVDVLLKYEGRVDRFLGDGVLAVFGAPQAHESDPERAILAALEIREAARRQGLEVTAGINTGEVYVGGMGSERHQEVTVMGPVVNLASRLQGQAEPGQILVGEATHRLTRRAFEFAPVTMQIKGIAQPVVAYAATRALPRPEKTRGIEGLRAELIGRDDELTKLKEALAEVLQGRGQMASLIGEAGVGKSRLVAELKGLSADGGVPRLSGKSPQDDQPLKRGTPADSRPPLWLEGRCLELGMTASYWLFVDLFRDYFVWRDEEDDRARGDRLAAALRELAARGDLTRQRADEMGPLLGNLLSVRLGNEWDDRLRYASPEQIKHQTFLAVHDFFVALARQQPVVLVLEDLHWADTLSLDLISLLMEALRLGSLFLLCVYRPEREHRCWHLATIASRKCPERYTELHLRELTPLQSRRLVEALLTIENLPTAVKELILEKAHGNPFFVEEVLRSLIASGMVYREGEVWQAREGIEVRTVPDSVQSVILSRVDRLDRDPKRVLQSAAVIGRLFRRQLLARVLDETTELERALWELEEQEFIYQERVVPEEYSFKHVLTQETVYRNILRRRRTGFHQRVAEAVETLHQEGLEEYYEQLAFHYDRSGAEEKGIEYLLKAGEKSRRAYLNEEAISYLGRALSRLNGSSLGAARKDWQLEALKGLGQIYHGMGREPEAEEHFRQAIALGHNMQVAPRELVRFYSWLGEVLWWQNRLDEMIRVGEEGLSLLGNDRESLEAVLMEDCVAAAHARKGNYSKKREFADRRASLLHRLPYCEELRPAYIHVADVYVWSDKNIDRAIEWLKDFEQRAKEHHHLTGLADALLFMGTVIAEAGNPRGSIRYSERALELYTKIGNSNQHSWNLAGLTGIYLSLGELQQASEYAARGLKLAEKTNHKWGIAVARLTMGTVALCQGFGDRAIDALQEAVPLYREIGGWRAVQAAHSLGYAHLAQGQRDAALLQFEEAISFIDPGSSSFTSSVAGVWSDLAAAYDDPQQFLAFCHRWREEHPEVRNLPFVQWYLEPTSALVVSATRVHDEFASSLGPVWVWQDPFGDCSFTMQNGLEIHAANGRDLWDFNLSAPRVLRPASGEFAIQTVSVLISEEKPTIGGLLLWRDGKNYLRLDRGTRGRHEISFSGCLGNKDMILGRGRLPSERVFLRLERVGSCVNALCSADGQAWFTVGHVEFPVADSVEVGLHAIGNIDRTVYPGAYPDGTAIQFESFELWS